MKSDRNTNEYKKGRSVVAHLYTQGPWRFCVPAVVVKRLKNGNWLVEDESGTRVDLPPEFIFPSQEAFEASIKTLAVSVNTQTGRITEFR